MEPIQPKNRTPIPITPSETIPAFRITTTSVVIFLVIAGILLSVFLSRKSDPPDSPNATGMSNFPTLNSTVAVPTKIIIVENEPTTPPASNKPSDSKSANDSTPPLDTMVLIPAGEFDMGASEAQAKWHHSFCNKYDRCIYEEYTDMLPIHTVYIDSFFIDVHEITNSQYRACVKSNNCNSPNQSFIEEYLDQDYFTNPKYDLYPVVSISWKDAVDFCEWSGKRLPTEAEWEKAAKNGADWTYAWLRSTQSTSANTVIGNGNLPINFCDKNCLIKKANWIEYSISDNWGGPAPVMSFPPNLLGLYDLNGNVQEWVQDYYSSTYYGYSPATNPINNVENSYRVVRGGGWNNGLYHTTSMYRRATDPNKVKAFLGFRCAKDIN